MGVVSSGRWQRRLLATQHRGKVRSTRRCSGSEETWGALSTAADPADCEVTDNNTDLVGELGVAIRKKARRYPSAVQTGLVLALDASRLPGKA